jgi:hypothetical protein
MSQSNSIIEIISQLILEKISSTSQNNANNSLGAFAR